MSAMDERSRYLRRRIIDALEGGGRGHIGSSLSLVEILRVLYDDVLRVRPDEPGWPDRDRCILSKGHGCLTWYAVLADKGFFPQEELLRQCHPGAMLGGHPERAHIPGVEASTGSLGHGLSIGIGMALAARLQRRPSRVFVITGDGELDEGSIWEGAMSAAKHRLDHLTVLVDYNKLQSYGLVKDVLDLEPLADKWRAFGWAVREVDGHDVAALRGTLGQLPFAAGQPSVVICHTVKGKGFDFAEFNPDWHHKAKVGAADVASMREALERAE
ncbi:transketolase subunit A [Azospirillum brasilense]|uniref:Transketolase subunit A n=2 Tax=Azospirillaceae TaxID=2829815 RepID=A0A560AKZ8_AZOBR|nr:transketolase subunit A [Azospirillum brasilense]